jgi:pimeloyl-ACP methyl ester carboxylesterase
MRIRINGVRLFFDVEGAGLVPSGPAMRQLPTLILLHGGPGLDHSSFKPAFSRLADVAQIVYLDHRGNGRSDGGPRTGWNLAQWGDDVFAFCEALEIERPVVMGHSFGGMVAMAYATRHPGHPGKLILSSTSAAMCRYVDMSVTRFAARGGPEAGALARRVLTRGYDSRSTAVEWLKHCVPLYNTAAPEDPDAGRRALVNPDVLLDFFGPAGECLSYDLLADLARIRCPTLVMGGEEDPMTPIEAQADIAAAIAPEWVQFRRFAGAGHGVFIDDDTAFDTLRAFIAG